MIRITAPNFGCLNPLVMGSELFPSSSFILSAKLVDLLAESPNLLGSLHVLEPEFSDFLVQSLVEESVESPVRHPARAEDGEFIAAQFGQGIRV